MLLPTADPQPPTPEGHDGLQAPLRFGRFELRPREYRLLCDDQPVALGGRAMDLLLALAARRGELLTRHELIDWVWPGRVVEDNNLSVQIKALRKVLGDEWLVTVPGRGYRLERGDATTAPPAAAPAAPALRPRVPLPPLPLIGREADLAALQALVDRQRLVTVTGAGGIGKTRLAQALVQARSLQPDPAAWVELAPLETADALPAALAAALGCAAGSADPLAQSVRTLGSQPMLLVLDSAEHLVEAVAALVQTLLERCSGLRLLVTSQAPLKLAAEHRLRLGPLALPQAALTAVEARTYGAVALFCDRASAADHRFVLRDADVPAVVGLCGGLDGLPLAIELAASRATALGIEALRAALADRLQLLGRPGHRQAPARQRSLRAALEWSVSLLPPAARRLFCNLGVTVGSASLDLVLQLACDASGAAGGADTADTIDALDELVQRSLVDLVQDDAQVPLRFRLLESPRALALDLLAAAGEEDAARLRHAHAVLADFEAQRKALQDGRLGSHQVDRLGELNQGQARTALQHAHRHGLQTLELALAGAAMPWAASDERLALARRCAQLLAALSGPGLDPLLELRVQRSLAIALVNLQPGASEAAARRAVDLARQVCQRPEQRHELYAALCSLAQKLSGQADFSESQALLQQALALEDPAWPAVQKRAALRTQALLAMKRGDSALAVPLYRRLLDEALAAGENGHVPRLQLANAALAADDAATAVAEGRRLVAELAGTSHDNVLVHASANLMLAHLALDQVDAARAIALQLWGGARPAPLRHWVIDGLALLAALQGRHGAAARLSQAADAHYQAAADQRQPNEQRAHQRTQALLAQAGCSSPADTQATLGEAELIALALA